MNPTTPRPTDAAIALVREALHSGVLMHAAAPDDVIKTRTPGFSVDGALMRDRLVEGLFAHPTLARVIAIGQAVDALVAVTHPLDHIVIARSRHGSATAWNAYTMNNTDSPRNRPPEADALVAALTDQERGS